MKLLLTSLLLKYHGLSMPEPTWQDHLLSGFLYICGMLIFVGLGISFFQLLFSAIGLPRIFRKSK